MENLKDISKAIFLKNAKLRGEGIKKKRKPAKKAPAKKAMAMMMKPKKAPAKKRGGVVIGGKRKLPAGASAWLDFVRSVYNQSGLSWKDSLVAASKMYKKM
jgi:hypothetical protein